MCKLWDIPAMERICKEHDQAKEAKPKNMCRIPLTEIIGKRKLSAQGQIRVAIGSKVEGINYLGCDGSHTTVYIFRTQTMYLKLINFQFSSVQFNSVTQSCPTLCEPMDCSMPGLPVHHQLPEFTQTHVHWVSDAIQPSHPLLSPSPPAFNHSQHQGLFHWVSSSHQVVNVLELQHQSLQWIFSTDSL